MTTTTDSILDQLHQARQRRPELRFGQLIAIIGTLAEDAIGHSLWDVEDADFADALDRFAADVARSGSDASEPVNGTHGHDAERLRGNPTVTE